MKNNQQKSPKINKNRKNKYFKSLKIIRNLQKSLKLLKNHLKSAKMLKHLEKSLQIHKNRQIFLKIWKTDTVNSICIKNIINNSNMFFKKSYEDFNRL